MSPMPAVAGRAARLAGDTRERDAHRICTASRNNGADVAPKQLPCGRGRCGCPVADRADGGLQHEVVLADYLHAERAAGLARIVDADHGEEQVIGDTDRQK